MWMLHDISRSHRYFVSVYPSHSTERNDWFNRSFHADLQQESVEKEYSCTIRLMTRSTLKSFLGMRWWSTIACVTLSVLITCVVQPCVATEQWEPNHPVGHRRQTWRKEEYPHAWYDRELCRTSTGLVCDPDCILTDAQVNQMETRLQLFYHQFHDTILTPPVTNPNKLKNNLLWWSNIHSKNDLPASYGTHVKISVVLLRKVRFIFSVHTGHYVPKYSARCRSDTHTHTHTCI
jgi:Modulator of levamisole receptor-1